MGEELGGGVLAAVVESDALDPQSLVLARPRVGPATITMPSSSWMNTRPGVPP